MNIAVLGAGLLGGSIALEYKGRGSCKLWARRRSTLDEAIRLGICAPEDASETIGEAVAEARLAVICTPSGAVASVAAEAAEGLPDGALITDVASVKRGVVEATRAALPPGRSFVGSHPMAGSHEAGIAAARPGLFRGANCILTPVPGDPPEHVELVEAFWASLGCRVFEMSPEAHDRAVAAMSHIPHAAAAALTNFVCALPDEPARICGNGFLDTTRVAAGPSQMWAEILMWNRDNILDGLKALAAELERISGPLRDGDMARLAEVLEEARLRRSALSIHRVGGGR